MNFSIENLFAALNNLSVTGVELWVSTDNLRTQTLSMSIDLKMMGF